MQLIRRKIFRSGKEVCVATLDLEGDHFDLDIIETRVEDRNEILVNEDLDDIQVNNFNIDMNHLYFYIDTYRQLVSSDDSTQWNILMRPANEFLRTLSREDTKALFLFYFEAKKIIDDEIVVGRSTLSETAILIGNKLYDLVEDNKLAEKLLHYCTNHNIPIPDLSYAGTRIGQDREEMTFRENEYYLLMSISVLCKLLSPVWGDLIYRTSKDVDTMQKEILAIDVIIPVLNTPFFISINNKLFNYIANMVNSEMTRAYDSASFTATIKGFSQDRFHQVIFATMLIKRYVNVDFYGAERNNIMVWTATSAKNAFNSTLQSLTTKCQVMKRLEVVDGVGGDDEASVSVLEHASQVTTVSADIPVLIQVSIEQSIKHICKNLDINSHDLDQAMRYYIHNQIQVNVLNKIVVGMLLGNKIGGARGIKYLYHLDYTKLVVISQIYISQNIPSMLVHLLTSTTSAQPKSIASSTDTRISMTFESSKEYIACTRDGYAIKDISMESIIKKVKDFIVKYSHYTNTSPSVCATLDQDDIPKGTIIEYDEFIIRNFCSLILHILTIESPITREY